MKIYVNIKTMLNGIFKVHGSNLTVVMDVNMNFSSALKGIILIESKKKKQKRLQSSDNKLH